MARKSKSESVQPAHVDDGEIYTEQRFFMRLAVFMDGRGTVEEEPRSVWPIISQTGRKSAKSDNSERCLTVGMN